MTRKKRLLDLEIGGNELSYVSSFCCLGNSLGDKIFVPGGVRPPSPPRHDTTAPEESTPARVQPPRQAKMKDAEFHYTK